MYGPIVAAFEGCTEKIGQVMHKKVVHRFTTPDISKRQIPNLHSLGLLITLLWSDIVVKSLLKTMHYASSIKKILLILPRSLCKYFYGQQQCIIASNDHNVIPLLSHVFNAFRQLQVALSSILQLVSHV